MLVVLLGWSEVPKRDIHWLGEIHHTCVLPRTKSRASLLRLLLPIRNNPLVATFRASFEGRGVLYALGGNGCADSVIVID
jgi:hypothetical protein